MTYTFRPASTFTDQHGLFIALVGGTNSGKTFSALRLARGIAGPAGKVAVADTEGGRTLHLKDRFSFDVSVMSPPHRPDNYLNVARDAEAAGYACLLIDSFTMEWRGIGGVLDWQDEELDVMVERQRARAADKKWDFDEHYTRQKNKLAASIRPKMAHKLMVAGFLGLRIPIIFAIRGEMTLDPDTKKEKFKPQCAPNFLFEVTVSFRLASERRGIIDLSDPGSYKMEGAHRSIFKDGEQLSEKHGEQMIAWARGATSPAGIPGGAQPAPAHQDAMPGPAGALSHGPNGGEAAPIFRWLAANGQEARYGTAAAMVADIVPRLAKLTAAQAKASRERNAPILAELTDAGHGEQAVALSNALAQREAA